MPVPNPAVLSYFTNSSNVNWSDYGLTGAWDGGKDAPYNNPVTGAGPTSITPAGSVQFQAASPSGYPGGQLNMSFNPSLFQSVGFDVYYDGPTPITSTDFGGFQVLVAGNGTPDYGWTWIGSVPFNAGMIGKWTHFNMPCAASGRLGANGFAFQGIPNGGGTTPITFHIDNIQLWNPVTRPVITAFTPNTAPGGVQIALDGNGTSNINDQEGICSPSAVNSATDFFWINQTPAAYSITLTNFPKPAASFSSTATAPASAGAGFDAHVYLCNGDSITAFNNLFGYNQTYSGASFNMVDYLGMHVQNESVTNAVTYTTNNSVITTNTSYGLAPGVVAILDWKTNSPNANATNQIVFHFPGMASANGTWSLNFSVNTHGSIVAADGSVKSLTLPDFSADPNYTANFTPVTSMVHFGVFKNGRSANNNLGTIFTQVLVTNSVLGTILSDSFGGPGLTANYTWQVAEYYQFAANRTTWIPASTAYWLTWNTTTSGWGVQSSSNLLGAWSNAGVTYTYIDGTGTNTIGAVSTTNLPAGKTGFFELMK